MTDTPDIDGLPPDRGAIDTEQRHPASADLDALPVASCVDLFIDDHDAVPRAVRSARNELAAFIDGLIERMRRGGRLISLGAGTSGRLGVLDASECPPTFQSDPGQVIGVIAGGDESLRRSSEGMEDDPDGAAEALRRLEVNEADTVLGIAAGGTTPYVLGGLHLAGDRGARTGLLTCAAPTAPLNVHHLIVLETGPEILTGSTRLKAGSATKLALNTITTTAFVQLGKVYGHFMVDLRATNAKLTDRAMRILLTLCPGLDRPAAHTLLTQAGGELKTALVMRHRAIDADAARTLLDKHQGLLRPILGPPPHLPGA